MSGSDADPPSSRPVRSDAGPSERTALEGAGAAGPRDGLCPHRVRWRRLTPSRKALFALLAPLVLLSLACGALGAMTGLVLVGLAMAGVPAVTAPLSVSLLVGSTLLAVGAAPVLLAWRYPHRPTAIVFRAGMTGSASLAGVAVVLAVFSGQYWMFLLAVPPFALGQVSWYFHIVLSDRAACATHPELGPHLRAMVGEGPAPAPQAPVDAPYRIEDCPHFVRFGDLKPRHQAVAVVGSLMPLLNLGLLVSALFAVIPPGESGSSLLRDLGLIMLVLAVAVLNAAAAREQSSRARRLHRPGVSLAAWAIAAHAATGLCLGALAVVLSAPHLAIAVGVSVFLVSQVVTAQRELTSRSECRSDPGLPPKIRALLR